MCYVHVVTCVYVHCTVVSAVQLPDHYASGWKPCSTSWCASHCTCMYVQVVPRSHQRAGSGGDAADDGPGWQLPLPAQPDLPGRLHSLCQVSGSLRAKPQEETASPLSPRAGEVRTLPTSRSRARATTTIFMEERSLPLWQSWSCTTRRTRELCGRRTDSSLS